MGEATVSRWETGAQIQQRAMDRFLRVCLASPAAVELPRSDFHPRLVILPITQAKHCGLM